MGEGDPLGRDRRRPSPDHGSHRAGEREDEVEFARICSGRRLADGGSTPVAEPRTRRKRGEAKIYTAGLGSP